MRLFRKDILALDWDHRQVRAVVARVAQGQVDVRRMFHEPVPADLTVEDPAAFGAWLGQVLRRQGCARMRALVAIPREQVVLKELVLPGQTPEIEIPSLVQFQMQKELPFGSEEAVIDYTTVVAVEAKDGAVAPNELLIAAAKREVIRYYQQVAEAARLDLVRIGLRCWGNVQTVRACAPADASQRLLLVHVGPELTEIDIIRGGALLFSRSASVPLNEQEDPGEFLNRLTLEVVRSAQAARATVTGLELDAIIVAAPAALAPGIAEKLGQRLDMRAWVLEPGRGISLPKAHRTGAGEFSAVLGLVLGQTATGAAFDFLHPRRPVDLVARRRRKKKVIAASVAAGVALLLGANMTALAFKESRLRREATEVARDEAEAARIRKLTDTMAYVHRTELALPVWLDEYKKINDLWMSRWHEDGFPTEYSGEPTEDGGWRIRLTAQARQANVVDKVAEKIREMYPPVRFHVEAKPLGVDQSQIFGHRFEVTVRASGPAKTTGRKTGR